MTTSSAVRRSITIIIESHCFSTPGELGETRETSSVALARGTARPRARAADDLSAQGSGLRARQTKGGSHAPEIPTPTPAVNLRFNIDGLTKGLEGVGGLLVGEVEEKPE